MFFKNKSKKKKVFSGEGIISKPAVEELLVELLQALKKWY
jgi:hypothetical protein